MAKLAKKVHEHLEKARSSALAAVETYNRPGQAFRTRTFAVLISIAWTGLFHAIFFRRGVKPFYTRLSGGRGTRYEKVEGDPKHWELQECVNQYYGDLNPPERENLRFLVRLRNKIEHRDHPELDPALFGECQANLLNFEDMLVSEFGRQNSIGDRLVLALQFSAIRPREQDQMRQIEEITALIKEKRIPVASAGLLKPGQVVTRLQALVPHEVNLHTHTKAWQHFKARPAAGSKQPDRTKADFCIYDHLLGGYGYTEAWVRLLTEVLSDPIKYEEIVGQPPVATSSMQAPRAR